MGDYVYKPMQDSCPQEEESLSTSIDELDTLEILNRHSDEIDAVIAPDNMYPNILEKPLYVKTVPENGRFVGKNTVNKRTRFMDDEVNNATLIHEKNTSISNLSVKDFSTRIATSLLNVLNDLLVFRMGDGDFTTIFTKDDRLIAIGILLVIISVFFIFFKNSC